MKLPPWANKEVSDQVRTWIAHGEGDHLEFKVDFGDRFAEEAASFGTSNGGRILLGVQNNGDVAGLPASTENERDEQFHRAQGIVQSVRPALRFSLILAAVDGKFILVIDINENQDHPVFYVNFRPHIRDGRQSRPANPEEVQQKVWSHPSSEHQRNLENLEVAKQELHLQRLADQQMTSNLSRMSFLRK